MSSLLQRLAGAVRGWVRFTATPTGVMLPLATSLAVLGVAGVAPVLVGVGAVLVASLFLTHKLAHLTATNRRLRSDMDALRKTVAALEKTSTRTTRRLENTRKRIDRQSTLVRETAAELRAEITGSALDDGDWHPVDATLATSDDRAPVLSIAIPGYNRPEKLAKALDSILDQVQPTYSDRVEVVITDDRSPDKRATMVAHKYASEHEVIGFRLNDSNLGLERNLIECAKACRGNYLWVFGNDDLLGPNALANLMPELEEGQFEVFLLDKERISRTDLPVDRRPGTRPADTSRNYDSILAMAESTGLISSFGWISQVVRRRAPYMAVDPEPYFDTTLHPHIGMLLEAFPDAPVAFRAFTGVIHRTQDPRERLAESAGRPEASYMAGGVERDARWFGAGYAAMLQRVVDRSPITPEQLSRLNEAQWHEGTMLDWIEQNWRAGIEHGVVLDARLLADAEKLFRTIARPVPTAQGKFPNSE